MRKQFSGSLILRTTGVLNQRESDEIVFREVCFTETKAPSGFCVSMRYGSSMLNVVA